VALTPRCCERSGIFPLRLACTLLAARVRLLSTHAGPASKPRLRSSSPAGNAATHGLCSQLMVWLFGHSRLMGRVLEALFGVSTIPP
jgi:hypothetical protein